MSQAPPLRSRPNLHLGLTKLTGSPRHPNQSTPPATPFYNPYPSPGNTPLAKTANSPFSSAGFKAPHPYGSRDIITPRDRPRDRGRYWYGNCAWFRIRRILASKPIVLVFMLATLSLWWVNGGSKELDIVKHGTAGLGKEFLHERRMHNYQFYPATNPKIHVGLTEILHLIRLILASTLGVGLPPQIDCADMGPFQVLHASRERGTFRLIRYQESTLTSKLRILLL